MINSLLFPLFRCPVSGLPLVDASPEELQLLRQQLPVDQSLALDSAFVTTDRRRAYPVRDGIPVLLPSAAVDLSDAPRLV